MKLVFQYIICIAFVLSFNSTLSNNISIDTNNYEIIDKYYKKIFNAKKKLNENQLELIRNMEVENLNETKLLSDTTYYTLYKNYNIYVNGSNTNVSNDVYFFIVDNEKKRIQMNKLLKNMKYSLLYSIIDLSKLSFLRKEGEYAIFKRNINDNVVPFKLSYQLYYFKIDNSLLEKIEYHYNADASLKKMYLSINYKTINDNGKNMTSLFFDENGKISLQYKNYTVTDYRNE